MTVFVFLPMRLNKKNLFEIAGLLPLLVIYLTTLAPGLTWTNAGADGGDLIAAAATNGVAHPSGYPLYLLLAKIFQLLPFGTLAYRTNLMSAFFAWMTVLLVKKIVDEKPPLSAPPHVQWIPGIVSAYALGFAPLFWSQAVITEVYTLNAFFTALLILLAIRRATPHVMGIVCGLALGNHLTIGLLIFFLLVLYNISGRRLTLYPLLIQGLWMLMTAAFLYGILVLRAAMFPPVNWENPSTLAGLWRLLTGEIYREHYMGLTNPFESSQMIMAVLLDQFDLIGFTACVIGLAYSFAKTRLHFLLAVNFLAYIFLTFIYHSPDNSMYLIPALISMVVWLGMFTGMILTLPAGWKYVFLTVITINFAYHAHQTWPKVDASADSTAEIFGNRIMDQIPEEAVVFTKGDRALFTLWYFHFALGEHPHIYVISEELLGFAWYRETLTHTYPDLVVGDNSYWPSVIMFDNPGRPVCYVSMDVIFCDQ